MPEFVKMIVVLFMTCGIAAGSLGVVNMVTRAPIEKGKQQQTTEGLQNVFTAADEFKALDVAAEAASNSSNKSWEAWKDGQKAGYVFQISTQGYSGEIAIMFGIDANNTLTGLKVLNHTETPGLGAKITSPELFSNQFKAKRVEQIALKVDQSDGGIDGITAATISSRAVTRAVRAELEAFLQKNGGDQK